MYDLPTLARLNAARPMSSETETTRHCSYTGNVTRGIVLHSAKQRSTCFLSAGPRAELFRTLRLATSTPAQLDKLIESYFSS